MYFGVLERRTMCKWHSSIMKSCLLKWLMLSL